MIIFSLQWMIFSVPSTFYLSCLFLCLSHTFFFTIFLSLHLVEISAVSYICITMYIITLHLSYVAANFIYLIFIHILYLSVYCFVCIYVYFVCFYILTKGPIVNQSMTE